MFALVGYLNNNWVNLNQSLFLINFMPAQKQPPRPKHVPQRICAVCRQKTDKRGLTRLVYVAEQHALMIDPTGKRNGRGVYLCNQPNCWDKAMQTPILTKSLNIELTLADKTYLAAHKPVAMETHETMPRKM